MSQSRPSLLANLPSRGNLVHSAALLSSNIPTYVADHDTSPAQVVNTDSTNILLRSLNLRKSREAESAKKDKGKRPASDDSPLVVDGGRQSKRSNPRQAATQGNANANAGRAAHGAAGNMPQTRGRGSRQPPQPPPPPPPPVDVEMMDPSSEEFARRALYIEAITGRPYMEDSSLYEPDDLDRAAWEGRPLAAGDVAMSQNPPTATPLTSAGPSAVVRPTASPIAAAAAAAALEANMAAANAAALDAGTSDAGAAAGRNLFAAAGVGGHPSPSPSPATAGRRPIASPAAAAATALGGTVGSGRSSGGTAAAGAASGGSAGGRTAAAAAVSAAGPSTAARASNEGGADGGVTIEGRRYTGEMIEALSVERLRAMLKRKGAATSGRKEELIARLKRVYGSR